MSALLTRRVLAVGLVLLGLALPPFLDSGALSVLIFLELNAVITVGVSLLMGYAGQVSLGQAAFYASGAYAAALASLHGLPPLLGLTIAPLVAALFAALIGVALLRLRGHHLAFATLATQLIFLSVVGRMETTGGDIGLQGIPRLAAGPMRLESDVDYAYLSWIALALAVVITRNLISSRPGRALRALATSEVAAESSGIPVGSYKLAVFALAAGFAGLAGGIYAFYLGYIAPGSFPALLSFEYIVMAVVGGLGTVEGAVTGAFIVTLLVQGLAKAATIEGMPRCAPSVLSYAAYATLLILTVRFAPKGLAGFQWRRAAGSRGAELS